jgi:hypothetical protein
MASSVSYTTYIPGKPLNEQLEALSKPEPTIIEIAGISYKEGKVAFKPLKVNEIILDLTLKVHSAVGSSKEDGIFVYDEYIFTVKSKGDEKINFARVLAEEIEETIAAIFTSSLRKV